MDALDEKALALFPGKVVRKDLLNSIKGHLNVPTYVLEYLLGKYCSSSDPDVVTSGLEEVKRILTSNYIHPDQAELLKSKVKESGRYRVIDKVRVKLVETEDKYWAELTTTQLAYVDISDELVVKYEKLLAGGVWSIVDLRYDPENFHHGTLRPFIIDQLKPIQLTSLGLDEIRGNRSKFTTEEWIDFLLRGIGLEPQDFEKRLKLLFLCRLIPLVENNFNLVELGPRGTGKSYSFRELSPYSILVSGGETTVPSLFVSMVGRGKVGLVGMWDVVAFDEVGGLEKLSNAAAVQIMKDYMESGSFSRGKEEIHAMASFAFLGNIDFDITRVLRSTHLFVAFPEEMQDVAFLDRFHAYLPGWEIPKMHPKMFGTHYGFVVDHIAELFRDLRKVTYTDAIDKHFRLGEALSTRDKKAVQKTVSGLIKLVHPNGEYTKDELAEYVELALEMRRRVKEQLKKMGGVEYWNTNLTYIELSSGKETSVEVPEQAAIEPVKLPSEPQIGRVVGLAITQSYGTIQTFEMIASEGSGRLVPLGSMRTVMRESLRAAYEFVARNHKSLGIDVNIKSDYDVSVLATQMGVPKEGPSAGITILTGLVSAFVRKPVRNDIAMTGEITLMGKILAVGGVQEKLLAASEAGIREVYVPSANAREVDLLPKEIRDKLEIHLVSSVDEVLNDTIIGYHVSEIHAT